MEALTHRKYKLWYIETEFRSQKPEWAKRPATANRINFVLLVDSAALASPRSLLASRRERLNPGV